MPARSFLSEIKHAGRHLGRVSRVLTGCLLLSWLLAAPLQAAQPAILIGLDADMSSASAQAGEAIRRGAEVAIDEINAQGGVLGRPLKLVIRDHRGNPARGRDNILALAEMPHLVAVLGGLHSSVALKQVPIIHERELIYLGPWAAATTLVSNGYRPNYVFRVSVRDEFAGDFLVKSAQQRGFKRLGLLLERSAWGRSNDKAIHDAASQHGVAIVDVEWFNWGIRDLHAQLDRLYQAGADVIMLVANPREGVALVRSMTEKPADRRLPIISHWGISGGRFVSETGAELHKVDLQFLQTFTFHKPPHPARAEAFLARYRRLYPEQTQAQDIKSPVGTAQAYDLVHMLAKAIRSAGSVERKRVRDALEGLPEHRGLIRDYRPPFTVERHDALDASDFRMAEFDEHGHIMPTGMSH
jgi:branched-chain amino acid transport system substrate-binding protein